MRLLLLSIVLLVGCAADAPSFKVDPRTTLITPDAVEHAAHQTDGQRLLPAGDERFGVVRTTTILRTGPIEDPGRRDNLTTLTVDEEVWLLERVDNAWLLHASDGYIGYADVSAIEVVDADAFTQRLKNHTSPDAQQRIAAVIAEAETLLGTPYLWGGKTDQGIDCSGLMQTSYALQGVMLPRDSDMQAEVGRLVATRYHRDALLPGDLLFFMHPVRGKIHHVALHMADGRYIESAGPGVKYGSLNPDHDEYDPKRAASFAWARRVAE